MATNVETVYTHLTPILFCPHCSSSTGLTYRKYEKPKLILVDENNEQHTLHFGDLQDFECVNCGGQWLHIPMEDPLEVEDSDVSEMGQRARALKHLAHGWEKMTEEARKMQARHLDNHEGDVYHAMQSLASKFGRDRKGPMIESINKE